VVVPASGGLSIGIVRIAHKTIRRWHDAYLTVLPHRATFFLAVTFAFPEALWLQSSKRTLLSNLTAGLPRFRLPPQVRSSPRITLAMWTRPAATVFEAIRLSVPVFLAITSRAALFWDISRSKLSFRNRRKWDRGKIPLPSSDYLPTVIG
jgi:hypothetical protein